MFNIVLEKQTSTTNLSIDVNSRSVINPPHIDAWMDTSLVETPTLVRNFMKKEDRLGKDHSASLGGAPVKARPGTPQQPASHGIIKE